jgi:hypothetical protein
MFRMCTTERNHAEIIMLSLLANTSLLLTLPCPFGPQAVNDFHFAMINDLPRNAFYKTALDLAVRPGCTVLEIGTGSGLLSMLAARAGPDHV